MKNKRSLYESIMRSVAKEVKRALNEQYNNLNSDVDITYRIIEYDKLSAIEICRKLSDIIINKKYIQSIRKGTEKLCIIQAISSTNYPNGKYDKNGYLIRNDLYNFIFYNDLEIKNENRYICDVNEDSSMYILPSNIVELLSNLPNCKEHKLASEKDFQKYYSNMITTVESDELEEDESIANLSYKQRKNYILNRYREFIDAIVSGKFTKEQLKWVQFECEHNDLNNILLIYFYEEPQQYLLDKNDGEKYEIPSNIANSIIKELDDACIVNNLSELLHIINAIDKVAPNTTWAGWIQDGNDLWMHNTYFESNKNVLPVSLRKEVESRRFTKNGLKTLSMLSMKSDAPLVNVQTISDLCEILNAVYLVDHNADISWLNVWNIINVQYE